MKLSVIKMFRISNFPLMEFVSWGQGSCQVSTFMGGNADTLLRGFRIDHGASGAKRSGRAQIDAFVIFKPENYELTSRKPKTVMLASNVLTIESLMEARSSPPVSSAGRGKPVSSRLVNNNRLQGKVKPCHKGVVVLR